MAMPARSKAPHSALERGLAAAEVSIPEPKELADRLGLPFPPRRLRPERTRKGRVVKRIIDLLVAATLLVLAAPLMVLIAIAIKVTAWDEPVLFRQLRIGHSPEWAAGRSSLPRAFEIYKFRTMHSNSPKYGVTPSDHGDNRITAVGRFLRKTSLDELPQLINVLRGDMAFIGPRPEMPFVVRSYGLIHRRRLAVIPGITGLWQLYGSRSKPIHDHIEYDLFYIDHWSLGLDLHVIWKTLLFVVNGGNV